MRAIFIYFNYVETTERNNEVMQLMLIAILNRSISCL